MNVPSVRVVAQAKINLHLRVLSKDDSGFHTLETIFHRIDLADELTISVVPSERTIDVNGGNAGPAESNLAFLAANAYSRQTGWPAGFRIELEKRIPAGSGLGGGSADAAAVLRALDSIAPKPLGAAGLFRIAMALGSDVPFLSSDSVMALAWGRGERMLALAPLPGSTVLLVIPQFPISTGDAYRWLDESRAAGDAADDPATSGRHGWTAKPFVLRPDSLSSWESIGRFASNDFEEPVFERHGELRSHLGRLGESGALMARMTGSGSTLFGVFDLRAGDLKPLAGRDTGCLGTTTSSHVVQPVRVG